MALFGRKSEKKQPVSASSVLPTPAVPVDSQVADSASLAKIALSVIKDGVVIVDNKKLVRLINPSALTLTGYADPDLVVGIDVALSVRFEDKGGNILPDEKNPVLKAIETNQAYESKSLKLVSKDNSKKIPVEVYVIPTGSPDSDRIVTIRDMTKEKLEEDAQSEFISTASHEMRTPVASIEGYLGLALNPQTATIDERAKGYLEAAHTASQHLGKLFQDLLDVTKLDDRKILPSFQPIVLIDQVRQITTNFVEKARAKNLQLVFEEPGANKGMRLISQPIFAFLDIDFLNEIVSNLIENAIKYTPEGKSIRVSVRSENERGIIIVEDAGIGIASVDLPHIFQKFYRADNSQTREIGGTGLGLYLVKQRTEAMNGIVWAESIYGQGSRFFVSFPKISPDEYEKLKIASENELQLQKAQQLKQYQETAGSLQNLPQQPAISSPQPTQQFNTNIQMPQNSIQQPQQVNYGPQNSAQYVQATQTELASPQIQSTNVAPQAQVFQQAQIINGQQPQNIPVQYRPVNLPPPINSSTQPPSQAVISQFSSPSSASNPIQSNQNILQ